MAWRTTRRMLRRATQPRWNSRRAPRRSGKRTDEPDPYCDPHGRRPAHQALPENCVAVDGLAVQVLPLVLGVRGAGDQQVRHTPRACACRVAVAEMQPMEPRRV